MKGIGKIYYPNMKNDKQYEYTELCIQDLLNYVSDWQRCNNVNSVTNLTLS